MNYKKTSAVIIFFFLQPVSAIGGGTNLGTIQTIRKGFATVKECQQEKDKPCSEQDNVFNKLMAESLDLATTGQCVASLENYEKAGIDVLKCPENLCDLKGLSNIHPR